MLFAVSNQVHPLIVSVFSDCSRLGRLSFVECGIGLPLLRLVAGVWACERVETVPCN